MFTLVWDLSSETYKGYVDGVYLGQSAVVSGYGAAGNIIIGSRGDQTTSFSSGSMWGVNAWQRELTAQEVLDLYNGTKPTGAIYEASGTE